MTQNPAPSGHGPGRPASRDGLLIIDDPARPLTAAQRQRLDALRDASTRSGDVVVVASSDADQAAAMHIDLTGTDLFSGHPQLAQDLRRLGVKRLTVAGSHQEKVAATCNAGRRAGFTMDLVSLHSNPTQEFMGDGDVDLLPGDTGGAPIGAQATGPIDDGRTDAVVWDDTWALRGEPSPADQGAKAEGGVRGWISKKLQDAKSAQDRKPGR